MCPSRPASLTNSSELWIIQVPCEGAQSFYLSFNSCNALHISMSTSQPADTSLTSRDRVIFRALEGRQQCGLGALTLAAQPGPNKNPKPSEHLRWGPESSREHGPLTPCFQASSARTAGGHVLANWLWVGRPGLPPGSASRPFHLSESRLPLLQNGGQKPRAGCQEQRTKRRLAQSTCWMKDRVQPDSWVHPSPTPSWLGNAGHAHSKWRLLLIAPNFLTVQACTPPGLGPPRPGHWPEKGVQRVLAASLPLPTMRTVPTPGALRSSLQKTPEPWPV